MSNEETKADCVRNIVTLKDLALSAKSELEQEASRRAVAVLKAKQIEIAKARRALDTLESQYSQLCLMTLEEFAAKEPGYSLAFNRNGDAIDVLEVYRPYRSQGQSSRS